MNIVTVFAGREENLKILLPYLKEALRRNIIQEVHLWNNTRNDSDDAFLRSCANLKRCSSFGSGHYTRITPVIQMNSFTLNIKAANDIHIKLTDIDEYEIVLGGLNNTRCVVRENGRLLFDLWKEGIAESDRMASYQISLHPLSIKKDGQLIFSIPIQEHFNMNGIYLKTGHGAVGDLSYETTEHSKIYLMDTCEKSWKNYYHHYKSFLDDIILKCDDDIVFMDLERMSTYLQFIQNNDYDLVFANTINNGVSAYYQQHVFQLIPETIPLEYPPGGYLGSLWDSGQKANQLHDYFLENTSKFLTKEYPETIPITTRFSINFFGYKGKNWHKICDCYVDDEYKLTVEYLNKGFKNVLYPSFYVSHLSFSRQNETGIHLDCLRSKYKLLAKRFE